MVRRLNNLIPYSRDYRRPPRWGMGLPPHRPRRVPLSDPRRWLKLVVIAAGVGLVVLPGAADVVSIALSPASPDGCKVTKVIDGDTILLWCGSSGIEKVRLQDFDTPEVFSPMCPSEWARGIAAGWHLRRIFFQAKYVTFAFAGRDRYGRKLAAAATDKGQVAARMIADGYARAYAGGVRQGWCL